MKKNLMAVGILVLVASPVAAQTTSQAQTLHPAFKVTFGQSLLAHGSDAAPAAAKVTFTLSAAVAPVATVKGVPLTRWQSALGLEPKARKAGDIDWIGLATDQVKIDGFMHLFRFTMESETRHKMVSTKHVKGYVEAVKGYFNSGFRWNDGDPFIGNNINHPFMGAVSSHVYTNNDRRCKGVQYGDAQYWACLERATIFSVVASVNWEWNPVMSESALGGVGRYHTCTNGKCVGDGGWSDFVMTPAGGLGIRLAGDIARAKLWPVLDEHLSGNVAARILKNVLKVATDPAGLANRAFNADFQGALSSRVASGRR